MWYLINDRVVKYHFPASDNNIQALSGFFHDKIYSCYYKHVCYILCGFTSLPQRFFFTSYLIWCWHSYTAGYY